MIRSRFVFTRGVVGLSLLCLSPLPVAGFAQTPQERAQVDTFLKEWKKTNLVADTEFDKLKPLGKKALPLLAAYLPDKELGNLAEWAMQRLDPDGAMPYLLKNLPNKDHNIQAQTFGLANRRMLEYDWYVRSGKPPVDPAQPAPRYASNVNPYPFRKAIHHAAVQGLRTETLLSAETHAIRTIGLTGDRRDIPLLRKYAAKEGGAYQSFCIASMARLGDKQALETIIAVLEKPVLPHPAAPYWTETRHIVQPASGAVVASREDSQRLREAASQAAFAMDRRLIPYLLLHMDDPPGQFYGDSSDPSPAHEAMAALSQIVYGKEYAEQVQRSAAEWKQWGQEHAKEFRK